MEDIVNLLLDVGDWVDVAHDRDLEGLLAAMCDDSKHKAVIMVEQLLIEEKDGVQDGQVGTTLNVGNYLGLQRKKVRIREYQFVELLNINHGTVFLLTLGIYFPDNKNWKVERRGVCNKFQTALLMHLVKCVVYNKPSFIAQRIDFWLYGWNLGFPTRLERDIHPLLWGYLDKALRLPDWWILRYQLRYLPNSICISIYLYSVVKDRFHRRIYRWDWGASTKVWKEMWQKWDSGQVISGLSIDKKTVVIGYIEQMAHTKRSIRNVFNKYF